MPEEKIPIAQIQAAISASGASWQAGHNAITELPPEEQLARLGVPPPPGGFETVMRRAASARSGLTETAIGLPTAYNLRNVGGKNFITKVKDQGACGSCVAFGACATIEGRFRVQRNDPNLDIDLSEAHLFFVHARNQGYNCNTGWWPNNAYDAASNPGITTEDCFPYNTAQQDPSNLCANWQSTALRITGYSSVSGAAIKQRLVEVGPVSACFVVYNDFFSYTSGVYKHVTGGEAGGHCVSIVGYDDAQGCWICKNSWGTGWGEQGFFKIAYGECGIDTWDNDSVNAVAETMWLNNRKVVGLWTIAEDRNAWAYLDGGIGWRRIAADNDNTFVDMLTQLSTAKIAKRPVNVYEDNAVIKQAYIL